MIRMEMKLLTIASEHQLAKIPAHQNSSSREYQLTRTPAHQNSSAAAQQNKRAVAEHTRPEYHRIEEMTSLIRLEDLTKWYFLRNFLYRASLVTNPGKTDRLFHLKTKEGVSWSSFQSPAFTGINIKSLCHECYLNDNWTNNPEDFPIRSPVFCLKNGLLSRRNSVRIKELRSS